MRGVSVKKINIALQQRYPQAGHKIVNTRYGSTKLYVTGAENHASLVEELRKAETPFHTYTPAEVKPITVLLKRITGYTNEEIEEDIKRQFPEIKSIKVKDFSTPRSRKQNEELSMKLVQVLPEEGLEKLFPIEFILYQKVVWEDFKSTGGTQCKNCQRFGHTATNCGHSYRCVKCPEKHGPGQCKRSSNDAAAYCVNCNKQGHPASYRGCPIYINRMDNIERSRNQARTQREERSRLFNNYYSTNRSYADCARMTSGMEGPRESDPIRVSNESDFLSATNRFFGMSAPELLRKIYQFLPKFKGANSLEQQQFMLVEFYVQIANNKNARTP